MGWRVLTLVALLAMPGVALAETPLMSLYAGFNGPQQYYPYPVAPAYVVEWDRVGLHWAPARVPQNVMTLIQVAPDDGRHWVSMKGWLGITHGWAPRVCNLLLWVRTPGDGGARIEGVNLDGIIPYQALAPGLQDGARETFVILVQTDEHGRVDIGWTLTNSAGPAPEDPWPMGCASSFRLGIVRVE